MCRSLVRFWDLKTALRDAVSRDAGISRLQGYWDIQTVGILGYPDCSHSPYLTHYRMSPPGILQEYWDIQTRMYLIIVSVSVADKLKRSQI